jgi:quercetin dioxygenase-like cupin family protein
MATICSRRLTTLAVLLLAPALLVATARHPVPQATTAPSAVPITSEPRHHPVFENDDVRVFDVLVPAGGATLFHLHERDYVYVTIGGARLKAENAGQAPTDLPLKAGDVRFAAGPLTHRVVNIGATPFRNLTVELRTPPAGPLPALDPAAGQTVVLENSRVRVVKLVLAPGAATALHHHPGRSLVVVVRDGVVTTQNPGQPERTMPVTAGQYFWQAASVTHTLRNDGPSALEVVHIELK